MSQESPPMKKVQSFLNCFIVVLIIVIISLACNSGSKETTSTQSNTPTTSPSTAPTSAPKVETAQAAVKDIAGNYEVSGTNVDGQGAYNGKLLVTQRDEVYQFSWTVGTSEYDGVGVQTDDTVAVSYTNGINGKGCGVVLYKINADGSLDGKAGYWGVNSSENEKATRTSGTDLAGDYEVVGTDTSGKEYKTKLTIAPSGPGFTFKWAGATPLQGLGIRQDNMVAAGFGGKQCAFVAYDIKPDGSLEGKWGGMGTVAFGTEKASKK